MRRRVPLAPDGVTLHPARVRARLQLPVRVAADGTDAAERPGCGDLDVVPAVAQSVNRFGGDALLDRNVPHARLAGIERARECLRVMPGGVDRLLQVQA